MLNITPPPAFQGDEQTQLIQVYRYLFRLSEELNAASAALDTQASKAGEAIAAAAGVNVSAQKDTGNQYTALVSLIVKTAEIVEAQMTRIVTRLESSYVAKSEWGEYKEEVTREIEDTAKYTLEHYQYGAEVFNIPEMAADFEAYKIEAEGYIKRGIIGYNTDNTPIFGIAIGQELESTQVTIDGVIYDKFDTTVNMATYTAEKLSFWINGVEVAYLSNGELYVTRIIVLDSIMLGGWFIDVNGKDEMTVRKEFGQALILAETLQMIAENIDLHANAEVSMLIGANDEMQKWFKFTNDRGLIIRKPEYTDASGTVHPASIWYTVTDEVGYHIYNTQQTAPVGSFQRGGLNTTGVTIGDIACKRTTSGGWVWTDTD